MGDEIRNYKVKAKQIITPRKKAKFISVSLASFSLGTTILQFLDFPFCFLALGYVVVACLPYLYPLDLVCVLLSLFSPYIILLSYYLQYISTESIVLQYNNTIKCISKNKVVSSSNCLLDFIVYTVYVTLQPGYNM